MASKFNNLDNEIQSFYAWLCGAWMELNHDDQLDGIIEEFEGRFKDYFPKNSRRSRGKSTKYSILLGIAKKFHNWLVEYAWIETCEDGQWNDTKQEFEEYFADFISQTDLSINSPLVMFIAAGQHEDPEDVIHRLKL